MSNDELKEQILNMYVEYYEYDRERASSKTITNILNSLENAEILLVEDGIEEAYEGDGFVLYRKDGKLYENNSSHCSCSGHEGQWEPEETFKEALLLREFGTNYSKEQLARIKRVIGGLK